MNDDSRLDLSDYPLEVTSRIIQHKWDDGDRVTLKTPLWDYINTPVDLSFADPPYNYGVDYKDDPSRDHLLPDKYRYWISQVIRKMANMTKFGGMLFWLCPADDGHWVWPELCRYGVLFQGKPIIWYERFSQYQAKKLTSDYRLLFPLKIGIAGTQQATFNPDDIREESVRQQMGNNPAGRIPGHMWTISWLQGNHGSRVDWHPAQLPPLPLARIVEGWTNRGDTVLDAFAGSGSLGVVCKGLGRNFVGVEQSTSYCDRMTERINTAPSTFVKPKKGHV